MSYDIHTWKRRRRPDGEGHKGRSWPHWVRLGAGCRASHRPRGGRDLSSGCAFDLGGSTSPPSGHIFTGSFATGSCNLNKRGRGCTSVTPPVSPVPSALRLNFNIFRVDFLFSICFYLIEAVVQTYLTNPGDARVDGTQGTRCSHPLPLS